MLAALLLAGASARALELTAPQRVDAAEGPCSSLAIAAGGPAGIAVAWVAEGTTPTLLLRERLNLLWNSALPLPALGTDPRDVTLCYDKDGRLHLAWTAILPQGRVVLHAVRATEGAAFTVTPLAAADGAREPAVAETGAADFPAMEPDAAGGVLIVWQETRPLQSCVYAAAIAADGTARGLGRISSARVSGMTPYILATQPAQVAWYELQPIGGELRVDEWIEAEDRWRPSATERATALFPSNNQVLLRQTGQGLIGAWPGWTTEGTSALHVGRAPESAEQPVQALDEDFRAEPAGDHASPTLSGTLPGRLTACWQAFTQGRQAIVISTFFGATESGRSIEVSPATQRFAALPAHATQGNWSVATWTDEARDGGDGGVYLREITW